MTPRPAEAGASLSTGPDARGHFGLFGGRYVAETLMPALIELEAAFTRAWQEPAFHRELESLARDYVGRPTPLYRGRRLGEALGGLRVFLKREDLCHTGAHKINNALGQALLARRMGKRRLIAETGAGQHGVATATVAALLGFACEVFMGAEDTARQALNVVRMRLLGARVTPVEAGSRTLKDAMNEALRDWTTHLATTHYLIGTVAGPHPYPWLVRELQAVIGREARAQLLQVEGRLPDLLVACVGGGSNALGLFHPFLGDPGVRMVAAEAGGRGLQPGAHAASLSAGQAGVLHGSRTLLLQDADGQILPTHSIAPGLDYPGVGPELSALVAGGRVQVERATDEESLAAFQQLASTEGILPALESAHALAVLARLAPRLAPDTLVLLNLSGRGDKDVPLVADTLGLGAGPP
ncbi:MAG: tryptophan synthase subunit beta [Deltaproteobacteria bacterium]|nr:tryptophan synthase subunit beta [Deltaproteobacteria bacterium]